MRMEDLDPPREEAGAAQAILASLQAHGLHWDEDVAWQGSRKAAYARALAQLGAAGHLFHCQCSRQQLGPNGSCISDCRQRQGALQGPTAIRVAVPAATRISFNDAIQGSRDVALGTELSDFVVRRKDGLDAYQLAVVVDDAWQRVSHVVRGSDLLDSTPRQIFLQQLLACPTPQYCHIPVITDASGQKLSKQNHAPGLHDSEAGANLRAALNFLCQTEPPARLLEPAAILAFATANWTTAKIPAVLGCVAGS